MQEFNIFSLLNVEDILYFYLSYMIFFLLSWPNTQDNFSFWKRYYY